jgi:hypothetical protein
MANGTPWHEVFASMFRSREVKSLMGLTGRLMAILGVAVALTIYGAGESVAILPLWREVIVAGGTGGCVLLYIFAVVIGINFPDQFHYGAEERLEKMRMERGDNLAGSAASRRLKGKP